MAKTSDNGIVEGLFGILIAGLVGLFHWSFVHSSCRDSVIPPTLGMRTRAALPASSGSRPACSVAGSSQESPRFPLKRSFTKVIDIRSYMIRGYT